MASSGQAAWVKYFQGKGDIKTSLKKDSPSYDANTPTAKLGDIPAGTTITYKKVNNYEPKALIEYELNGKGFTVRVPFDNIAKPGVRASAAASLKPQAFGLVGSKMLWNFYLKKLIENINERQDISGNNKTYLILLAQYWSGEDSAKAKIQKIFTEVKNSISISDVNKDYGEVLGPLACIKRNLLKDTFAKVTTNSNIFIPLRPNEPLMDYGVGDAIVSAKSGTTTNTVKTIDVLALLGKNQAENKKFSVTKEFKVLNILATNNTLQGPVEAVKFLLGNKFISWQKNNTYIKSKKGNVTPNELMYECEKYLQSESKTGSLNFTDIFVTAIDNKVIYVKFELDSTGVGEFKTIVADDLKKAKNGTRPFLRSKNGYTRAADKMGIQV